MEPSARHEPPIHGVVWFLHLTIEKPYHVDNAAGSGRPAAGLLLPRPPPAGAGLPSEEQAPPMPDMPQVSPDASQQRPAAGGRRRRGPRSAGPRVGRPG